LFAVVQSNAGLPASEIPDVAAQDFPVRNTAIPPRVAAAGRSHVGERDRTATRLAAQRPYRFRRGLAGP
jgi:hypothetical protein